jgi:hypothetical protein
MSASPDSGKLPGFCHIRRQSNRSAQKQIICPIYSAETGERRYRMGAGTITLVEIAGLPRRLRSEAVLIPSRPWKSEFYAAISKV